MGRPPSKNLTLPPGMRKRVRGKQVYYYYDTGAKPRREIGLGKDYLTALQKYAELEIASKQAFREEATFRYAATRYLAEVVPTKARGSQRNDIASMKNLMQVFGTARLDDVEPVHVRRYIDKRKSAPFAANLEKALLSHVFKMAREWGYTAKPNPCAGVSGHKVKAREVYVEDAAYNAVLEVADVATRDLMELIYLTGQRPSDVLKMAETDIQDGLLLLQQNKTGKKLRIAVTGELLAVIERIQKRKAGHAIRSLKLVVSEKGEPLTLSTMQDRFAIAKKKAGQEFQLRDLRAKALTDKDAEKGSREAQRLGGHTSITTTERYLRGRKGDKVEPTR
jgi:integrase